MKIVICGSMSVSKQMVEMKKSLEEMGHEVVLPKDADLYASGNLSADNGHESTERKIQGDLIRDYFLRIKDSDALIVANHDKKGIKNYVGGNSFLEAGFAHALNKKLYFINDIPEISYSDESRALQPIILKGDLSRVEESLQV